MILLKPKIDVRVENSITDKISRFILVEAVFDATKYIFLNVYVPNKQAWQIQFLRDLSNNVINHYANENIIRVGDFNCTLRDTDKCGGCPTSHKKGVIREFNALLNIHYFVDVWRQEHIDIPGFTWCNPNENAD